MLRSGCRVVPRRAIALRIVSCFRIQGRLDRGAAAADQAPAPERFCRISALAFRLPALAASGSAA